MHWCMTRNTQQLYKAFRLQVAMATSILYTHTLVYELALLETYKPIYSSDYHVCLQVLESGTNLKKSPNQKSSLDWVHRIMLSQLLGIIGEL